jgi:hypothetical protein
VGLEPPVEILGQGRGDPAGTRLSDWFQRHRRVTAALVAVAMLVAGGVVTALAIHDLRGPALPPLTVKENPGTVPTVSWLPLPGQRPGPVRLFGIVRVRRDPVRGPSVGQDGASPAGQDGGPGGQGDDGVLTLVGLSGPGVVRTDLRPIETLLTRQVDATFEAAIDCRRVPAAASDSGDGFRVRIRFRSAAGRVAEEDVPTDPSDGRWGSAVRTACGSWFARHDLTVTAVSASVLTSSPRIDARVTVSNSGDRPATLTAVTNPGAAIRLEGDLPASIPAHASRTIPLTVALDRCDPVPDPRDVGASDALAQQLTTVVNLVARAGAPEPVATPFVGVDGADVGTAGIVMADEPKEVLAAAMSQACGGMGPIVPFVKADSVRYDPRTRVMTIPLLIDLDRGKARSVRLRSQRLVAPWDMEFRALWDKTPDLVPDRTGQVGVTLRYRAPKRGSCPSEGVFVPGFDATVRAADGRIVMYTGTIELGTDPHAIQILCAPSTRR